MVFSIIGTYSLRLYSISLNGDVFPAARLNAQHTALIRKIDFRHFPVDLLGKRKLCSHLSLSGIRAVRSALFIRPVFFNNQTEREHKAIFYPYYIFFFDFITPVKLFSTL